MKVETRICWFEYRKNKCSLITAPTIDPRFMCPLRFLVSEDPA